MLRCQGGKTVQKLAVRPAAPDPAEPAFGSSLARDAEAASAYVAAIDAQVRAARKAAPAGEERVADVVALKTRAQKVKDRFFRHHATAIYDQVTDEGARFLRVRDVVLAAADLYPALLPTEAELDAERALKQQSAKEGRELDQGLFLSHILADERTGMHLIHAMLKPRREALERLLSISAARPSNAKARSGT
jgi:thioesterase DpgC